MIRDRCLSLLERLPEGRLEMTRRGNGSYYHWCWRGERRYLAVDSPEIEAVKNRKLTERMLKQAQENIRVCSEYLETLAMLDPLSMEGTLGIAYRNQGKDIYQLLGWIDSEEWMNADYERNMRHPEQLTCRSERGIMMRSRVETGIAAKYDEWRIAYRYEPVIILPDGTRISPDFELLLLPFQGMPRFYHEHFGMMGNTDYVKSFLWKNSKYLDAGLIPYRDVLYTFDSVDGTMDFREIARQMSDFIQQVRED